MLAFLPYITDTPVKELFHLLHSYGPEESAYRKQFHKQPLTIDIGDMFYLDIRFYSWEKVAANRTTWFSDLQLPDKNHKHIYNLYNSQSGFYY